MSRCQGRPSGRPAGTEAKRTPLTTTGPPKHRMNNARPPGRAYKTSAPREVRLI
jgi:hypothetical protein